MSIKPRSFDPSALNDLVRQAQAQDPSQTRFSRSNDPENFPVWSAVPEGKFLVYIPNHVVDPGDGSPVTFRADRPYLHRVLDGSRYGANYRCIAGLKLDGVYDGVCPLCEASSTSFEWWNAAIELAELEQNRSIRKSDLKQDKEFRVSLLDEMPVKSVNTKSSHPTKTVFPAVFFPLDKNRKLIITESGSPEYTTYWLPMTATQMDKILEAVDAADATIPGGTFLFSYDYSHNGTPNAMDAARYLSISAISPDRYGLSEDNLRALDTATEAWTPAKAVETVKENAFYDKSELEEISRKALAAKVTETATLRARIAAIRGGASGTEDAAQAALPNSAAPASKAAAALPDVNALMSGTGSISL